MDLQTFLARLDACKLLSGDIASYARDTAPRLTDAERETLMKGIETEYMQIESLEAEREKKYADANKKMTTLMKAKLPAIRKGIEKAQQDSAEEDASTMIDKHI